MKVLQVTAFSGWGCTGRIAQGISEMLINAGHDSVIAWGRKNTVPIDMKTIKIGNKVDQLLHGLYARLFDKCGFGSKQTTKRFIKKIEQFQPDIVHLHIMHGYYINVEILFNYLASKKIPIVWTFHDCWAFTGHCPYFTFVKCLKWQNCCERCEQKKHHPKSWFIDDSQNNYLKKKELFSEYDRLVIVTPSVWLKKIVEESFFKNTRIEVIRNGINTSNFRCLRANIRTKYNILPEKKILLGVSSTWVKEKGLYDFFELQNILNKESDDYQIVLVGLTKNQIRKIPNEIVGIERTDSIDELSLLYSEASVFLNLTYEDNYPTTNLEAIACGTPVISYKTGGSSESVELSGMGSVVAVGDLVGVVTEIKKISAVNNWENKGLTIDQKDCFLEYIKLYEGLIANNKGILW